MSEEKKVEETNNEGSEQRTRRGFVRTAAQVAVTAPAIGLLLSASAKAQAAPPISASAATASHILDDYTFGNNEEDIDGGASEDDFSNHGFTAPTRGPNV